ncbi:hypothetical protein BC829DRAFT_399203 [Chytridium lagenaria]|nr:hypothetical protein BC829DRAFT_399203 [Chytridium lagenaria]
MNGGGTSVGDSACRNNIKGPFFFKKKESTKLTFVRTRSLKNIIRSLPALSHSNMTTTSETVKTDQANSVVTCAAGDCWRAMQSRLDSIEEVINLNSLLGTTLNASRDVLKTDVFRGLANKALVALKHQASNINDRKKMDTDELRSVVMAAVTPILEELAISLSVDMFKSDHDSDTEPRRESTDTLADESLTNMMQGCDSEERSLTTASVSEELLTGDSRPSDHDAEKLDGTILNEGTPNVEMSKGLTTVDNGMLTTNAEETDMDVDAFEGEQWMAERQMILYKENPFLSGNVFVGSMDLETPSESKVDTDAESEDEESVAARVSVTYSDQTKLLKLNESEDDIDSFDTDALMDKLSNEDTPRMTSEFFKTYRKISCHACL